MRRSTLSLVLYLCAVFVSGTLVGALGYRLYTTEATANATAESQKPTPEEWRQWYCKTLTDRLNLTSDQLAQLNAILDQTKARFEAIDEEVLKPHKAKIRELQVAAVSEMLDERQRVEYHKWREERAERRRQEEAKRSAQKP